jgi:GNAT superfamily N-acetyltransferase
MLRMRRPTQQQEIEHAITVFVQGFSAEKSRTHPYEHSRVGRLWLMRDAPRKNARDYRKEEWIAYRVPPREADQRARRMTRGRFFVCAIHGMDQDASDLRGEYKALGYRLLATEALFVHRLADIPRASVRGGRGPRRSAITIEQMKTPEMAAQFGQATRTRPVPAEQLGRNAPFRQYLAIDGDQLVGWVRSVDAGDSTWCSNLHVQPSHRRRGIGKALMARMLRDDAKRGSRRSVLLASHAGALLYPHLGYEQIGTLLIFAPRKR